MPYSVRYGPEDTAKYPLKPTSARKKSRYVVAIALLILAIVLTYRFRETLVSWLIPGDDQMTLRSTEELLSDLRDGVPIGEALTAFCEEIVTHEE